MEPIRISVSRVLRTLPRYILVGGAKKISEMIKYPIGRAVMVIGGVDYKKQAGVPDGERNKHGKHE